MAGLFSIYRYLQGRCTDRHWPVVRQSKFTFLWAPRGPCLRARSSFIVVRGEFERHPPDRDDERKDYERNMAGARTRLLESVVSSMPDHTNLKPALSDTNCIAWPQKAVDTYFPLSLLGVAHDVEHRLSCAVGEAAGQRYRL